MLLFIFNSVLLGVGLAMDAFSVSLANGLKEPHMKKSKMAKVAGAFGIFQFGMPLIGWLCVHTIVSIFKSFEKAIPWIALILLCYIGGSMLVEGFKGGEKVEDYRLTPKTLFMQSIATSIDALSVGFTIAHYSLQTALISTFIIGAVTFVICLSGLSIGKVFGTKLSSKASILGGIILILIGIEIFVSNVL
jgi:putative Mn2+ efflux pump MntP